MILFTKEIIKKLQSNNKLNDVALAKAEPVCKFFTPHSNYTWYPFSMDEDGYCFGLVSGAAVEYGMFHRSELENYVGPMGIRIERDLHWTPQIFELISAHHKNIFVG
jgi:hypothetical protein|tara:strand:+ start:530 stop:850 length:321 start_codon:yes stop_codon:yes gene_type:complete